MRQKCTIVPEDPVVSAIKLGTLIVGTLMVGTRIMADMGTL
jgi:hypothetical protein